MKKILFENYFLYSGGLNEAADFFISKINEKKISVFTHINLRNFYYLQKDIILKKELIENSYLFFDGIGMKTAFALKGITGIKDLNGTDLFPYIMRHLEKNKLKVFLLGADEQVINDAVRNVKTEYPNLEITGFRNGYFSESEEKEIIESINKSGAEMLITGMGFPLQEKFVLRHKDNIKVKIIWNTGGLFDFISKTKKRAPRIILKIRLEWFYRMLKEPSRMVHRNTVAAFGAFYYILMKGK